MQAHFHDRVSYSILPPGSDHRCTDEAWAAMTREGSRNMSASVANVQVFAAFAGDDLDRWGVLARQPVRHHKLGAGTIVRVERGKSGAIHLIVRFSQDDRESRKFPIDAFCDERFFQDIPSLPDMEGIDQVRDWVLEEAEQKAEEARRKAEEEQRRREEQKRKEVERQREEQRQREERQRREAERKTREEQERRQQEREAADRMKFAALKSKYLAHEHDDPSPTSFLYPILIRLDSGERLEEEDVERLKAHRLYATLAIYYEARFQNLGDPWLVIRACGQWRAGSRPDRALSLSSTLLEQYRLSRKMRAAVLTTRGGALRDLDHLDDAERCARDAANLSSDDYHPYNLLGAIYFQLGQGERGEGYFFMARELGAPPRSQESEMRGAIDRAGPAERRAVAEYLFEKDPIRYEWAQYYLRE